MDARDAPPSNSNKNDDDGMDVDVDLGANQVEEEVDHFPEGNAQGLEEPDGYDASASFSTSGEGKSTTSSTSPLVGPVKVEDSEVSI